MSDEFAWVLSVSTIGGSGGFKTAKRQRLAALFAERLAFPSGLQLMLRLAAAESLIR